MGKPTICICETKGADQLRGNREADQRLCFRYSDSTVPLLLKRNFKILALFFACTGRFVSDLFGNHIVGFPTRRLKSNSLGPSYSTGADTASHIVSYSDQFHNFSTKLRATTPENGSSGFLTRSDTNRPV